MSDAILFHMAECRSHACGWIGPAYARREDLSCPTCAGATRTWVIDQAREQAVLMREQEAWRRVQMERSQVLQRTNAVHKEVVTTQSRVNETARKVKRCQGLLSLAEADCSPESLPYYEAKQNLIAAQRAHATAALAHGQALAKVNAREQR